MPPYTDLNVSPSYPIYDESASQAETTTQQIPTYSGSEGAAIDYITHMRLPVEALWGAAPAGNSFQPPFHSAQDAMAYMQKMGYAIDPESGLPFRRLEPRGLPQAQSYGGYHHGQGTVVKGPKGSARKW